MRNGVLQMMCNKKKEKLKKKLKRQQQQKQVIIYLKDYDQLMTSVNRIDRLKKWN